MSEPFFITNADINDPLFRTLEKHDLFGRSIEFAARMQELSTHLNEPPKQFLLEFLEVASLTQLRFDLVRLHKRGTINDLTTLEEGELALELDKATDGTPFLILGVKQENSHDN